LKEVSARSLFQRLLSVAVQAALLLCLLLAFPLGSAEVDALAYSDPPEHVYTLTGTTEQEVIANLKANFHDAIANQYARFDIVSNMPAPNA